MTEATELTLKQILDSAWMRRLARLAMIVLLPIVTGGGSFVGWVLLQNWQTSQTAVTVAADAARTAEQAQRVQEERAALADQRATDEKAWRDRFDAGLVRLNQRVSTEIGEVKAEIGELKGDIGEIKGLIVRQTAAEVPRRGPGVPFFAAEMVR